MDRLELEFCAKIEAISTCRTQKIHEKVRRVGIAVVGCMALATVVRKTA